MSKRTHLTRRDFMKGAAALGASAIAFPTIIPSSALGNDKVAAASERLTLGFIGIGKMSSGHLGRYLGKPAVQVLAVCDVHTGRREAAQQEVDKKYKELERKNTKPCDAYIDYRELLARSDIDAVVIGTPDHWHTAPLIAAAKAKKDIYCEKPLTLTIHEAKAAIDAIRKYEVVFQTGSQQRSSGPFRQAVDIIRSGRLGKIKQVLVALGGKTSKPCDLPEQPVPEGTEWDMWLGQAPVRPYNEVLCRKGLPNQYPFNPGWRDYREYSGGYVTDWGAHHLDITQWALDMDQAGPVAIRPPADWKPGATFGTTLVYRGSPVGGDEILVTHVEKIEDPVVADPKAKPDDKKKPSEGNGILFIGEKGKMFVNRGRITSDPEGAVKEPLTKEEQKVQQVKDHHDNWTDCIRTRERPICDVEVGARSVTVCHLTNLAYWYGKPLEWDAKKWEFTGANASEANAWRTREQREKYQLPTA